MMYTLWVKGTSGKWMKSGNDPATYTSKKKALVACEVQEERMGTGYVYRPRVLRAKKKVKK